MEIENTPELLTIKLVKSLRVKLPDTFLSNKRDLKVFLL